MPLDDSSSEDERPSPLTVRWAVEDACIARWSADWVWYNAEVLEVRGNTILVRFSDYANEAEVKEEFMLRRVHEIPEKDMVENLLDVHLEFQVSAKFFELFTLDNVHHFSLHVQMRGWW